MNPDPDLPEDRADPALADRIEALLPKPGSGEEDWSIQELRRLAVLGRITGDISGAVSAHRVLSDALGALRGEYGKRKKTEGDMTDEEAEAAILEAADHIRGKRKGKK